MFSCCSGCRKRGKGRMPCQAPHQFAPQTAHPRTCAGRSERQPRRAICFAMWVRGPAASAGLWTRPGLCYCSAVNLPRASRTLRFAQRSYANRATTSSCMVISPGLGQENCRCFRSKQLRANGTLCCLAACSAVIPRKSGTGGQVSSTGFASNAPIAAEPQPNPKQLAVKRAPKRRRFWQPEGIFALAPPQAIPVKRQRRKFGAG
jgi:hypothetical protein